MEVIKNKFMDKIILMIIVISGLIPISMLFIETKNNKEISAVSFLIMTITAIWSYWNKSDVNLGQDENRLLIKNLKNPAFIISFIVGGILSFILVRYFFK